jgi:erythromycin esterase
MAEAKTSNSKNLLAEFLPLQRAADLDPLLDRIGNARYVLLGEASHGTHEYYT